MNRTIICIFLEFALLLAGCSAPKSVSVQLPEPGYWPTAGWPTAGWQSATPESQGMDSELLARMIEQINSTGTRIHSVLVIRNGYVVTEAYFHPYTRDTKMHIQSVTKSVIGMLVGKAVGDGTIESEEAKLVDFYPNRIFENPGGKKNAIRLKHLLSMSSGLDCQEFSGGPSMEQTSGWVQFMLDLPMADKPGKSFGYCNGNAHLLSSILEKTTGMSAREYANQALFGPLGIPPVDESDWGVDPQRTTTGGYGLHMRPADLAKLAYLYLHNGKWDGQQLLPDQWVADSTTQHVQKEDGSGYGYLWTVYPGDGHYAALGLGGQQVHVYPSKNLIVVVTASLESFAEAPEIEGMLNDFVLPAIQADAPLAENSVGVARLEAVLQTAANPVQAVPPLPSIAEDISNSLYTFGENPMGWQTLELFFEPGAPSAGVLLNGTPLVVGMDNLYRLSTSLLGGELLLRGHWEQDNLFILDYPYPLTGSTVLGELGESEFHFHFTGDRLDVVVQQLVFGGEGILFTGSK
jgi:CubicO group peptidase (beta-lactamase class C family)